MAVDKNARLVLQTHQREELPVTRERVAHLLRQIIKDPTCFGRRSLQLRKRTHSGPNAQELLLEYRRHSCTEGAVGGETEAKDAPLQPLVVVAPHLVFTATLRQRECRRDHQSKT